MAIGTQPTMGGLNATITTLAVSLRDSCQDIAELWTWITTLGANEAAQVSALETLGFTAADAQLFWTQMNYLFAVSQLYYGQLSLASAFDYDSALAVARGGS